MNSNHREIERKFLVRGEYKAYAESSSRIAQAYLCSSGGNTVRIRLLDDKGYLTIKGPSVGISRFEWEMEIPQADARALLGLCKGGVIDKTRYRVPFKGHLFEVDEFYGDNEGLTVAEVELASETEPFEKPDWVGEEVSDDPRYRNSHLLSHPYKNW
ncbi:MAG: CYTH domain-containing protein [Bacteroidales bacterium]|nr:CYTH domain-containing protein [Bacteroidales bacterium]